MVDKIRIQRFLVGVLREGPFLKKLKKKVNFSKKDLKRLTIFLPYIIVTSTYSKG
jgi:hypothetical protein